MKASATDSGEYPLRMKESTIDVSVSWILSTSDSLNLRGMMSGGSLISSVTKVMSTDVGGDRSCS